MNEYVVCVGTSNVDIQGFAGQTVVPKDKNPGGDIEVWAGGVARNIGENLARLGVPVKMLTAIGDDIHATKILDDSRNAGMDMSNVLKLKNRRSGSYISITDTDGDLFVGLTDMSIAGEMTVDYFKSKQAILDGAEAMVLSPCVPADVLDHLGHHFDGKPIFLDVVSTGYVPRLRQCLGLFHTVKANLPEAEELSGIRIDSNEDLNRVANAVLEQGVQRMVISLGSGGVFYKDRAGRTLRKRTRAVTDMVNATGAGDALAAGLVYGYVHQLDLNTTLDFAMSAAILTLNHKNTINPQLSPALVMHNIQEWKL
jgi:pseudouridine kinase